MVERDAGGAVSTEAAEKAAQTADPSNLTRIMPAEGSAA
jgi:hypothetical protein